MSRCRVRNPFSGIAPHSHNLWYGIGGVPVTCRIILRLDAGVGKMIRIQGRVAGTST